MKEIGREEEKLQPKELAVLLQRLEELKLQHRKGTQRMENI